LLRAESITLSESQALDSFEFLEFSLSPRRSGTHIISLNSAHSGIYLASPDHKPLEKKTSVLSNTSEVLRASSPQLSLTNWKADTFESSKEGEYIAFEFTLQQQLKWSKFLVPKRIFTVVICKLVVMPTGEVIPVTDKFALLTTTLTEDSALGSDRDSIISPMATTGVSCVDKVCTLE